MNCTAMGWPEAIVCLVGIAAVAWFFVTLVKAL